MSSARPDPSAIDSPSESFASGNDGIMQRLEAEEEFFVKLYMELTHETESQARCVFMFVCEAWDNTGAHASG